MSTSRYLYPAFVLTTALAFTLYAVWFTLTTAGGLAEWRGILPRGTTDSLYYYARIHEVVDGYPFNGHPYAYEYREQTAPAFFIPDILTATPVLIGLPFNIGMAFNIFLWSSIFLFSAYILLVRLGVQKNVSLFTSVISYLIAYAFMLRPTVMQTTYPLFLVFLVVFLEFLKAPHSRLRQILLSTITALTFYAYTYLAIIIGVTLVALFAVQILGKKKEACIHLLRVGGYTCMFLIPYIVMTVMSQGDLLRIETLLRLGFLETHVPSKEAFFMGRWVVLALLMYGLLLFALKAVNREEMQKFVFWWVTGIGLLCGLFLNVLTGKELSLGVHVGRFVMVWTPLFLGAFLYELYRTRSNPKKGRVYGYLAIGLVGFLVFFLMAGTLRNIPRSFAVFNFDSKGIPLQELQAYASPLEWLEENVREETVVWSNLSLGSYIPIMTKHYPLFHNGIILHNIPGDEIEERYLLWRSVQADAITLETVKRDFDLYAGAGPTKDAPEAHNFKVTLCEVGKRLVRTLSCEERIDAYTLKGDEYFKSLEARGEQVVSARDDLLSSYRVAYALVDTHYDTFSLPTTAPVAYSDGRFIIFALHDRTAEPSE